MFSKIILVVVFCAVSLQINGAYHFTCTGCEIMNFDIDWENKRFDLFALGANANKPETVVRTDIKGRLLTPEEGCGYSKVQQKRIVGGGNAKNGKYKHI